MKHTSASILLRVSMLSLVAACAGVLASCSGDPTSGYSFSSPYRADIHTVAVPIFDNTTFNHGLEFQLTDALIKEIHRSTPWKIAPRDGAETVIVGTITRADMRRLTTQHDTGLPLEMAVDMSVNFEWKNLRTGKVLLSRKNFHASDEFVPALGAQESLQFGQSGAIDKMAKDIVAELKSSW